jgi:hypothetical protein
VHAVRFAVIIGIELGFDPEIVADPQIGVFEFGNDLRFTVLDYGNCSILAFCTGAKASE